MKRIQLLLFFILTLLFLGGCDKYLDLIPEDTLVEDKVFEKFSTTESVMAGTYHLLFQASTTDYVIADGSSPVCDYSATVGRNLYDDLTNGTLLPDNSTSQSIYGKYYAVVNQANLIIFKITELGKYNENLKKQHIAEAKFIRAYALHRLLAWFGDGAFAVQPGGPGIVLYLKHYSGFDRGKDILPRNTIGEVYDQIIRDLEEAYPDLPGAAAVPSLEMRVSRANRSNCQALLARVFLYMKNYQRAAESARLALEDKNYSLENDLLKIFPLNPNDAVIPFSKEHLFGFPVSSNNGNWQFGGNSIYYTNNYLWFNDAFLSTFLPEDLRILQITRNSTYDGKPVVVTNKYPNKSGRDNMTMIRLSEMMLTRAEALVAATNQIPTEALALLNEVFLRSNPSKTGFTLEDFPSTSSFLGKVWQERDRELCFEGLLRFDYLRTGRALRNPNLPDNKKVLPIPAREVEISNGVVVQNKGYQ